jgi:hypothetical protein
LNQASINFTIPISPVAPLNQRYSFFPSVVLIQDTLQFRVHFGAEQLKLGIFLDYLQRCDFSDLSILVLNDTIIYADPSMLEVIVGVKVLLVQVEAQGRRKVGDSLLLLLCLTSLQICITLHQNALFNVGQQV